MSVPSIVIVLGLAGIGVWLLYGARDLIRLGLSSYKWANVRGAVVDSKDESFTIAGIERKRALVPVTYKETAYVYEYQVGGHTYHCSTFCFGGHADRATAAYSIGMKVTVYYDPEHPEIAVLRRGLQFGAIIGVVPLAADFLYLFLSWRN